MLNILQICLTPSFLTTSETTCAIRVYLRKRDSCDCETVALKINHCCQAVLKIQTHLL